MRGIFIRDYKNWQLDSGIMGVAVSTGSIDTLVTHFGEAAFAEACEAITQERNLGLFCIVAIDASGADGIKKGFMVHRSKNSTGELPGKYASFQAMLEGVQDFGLSNKRELLFEATGNCATYYDIGNTKYSRKAIEAIVKQTPF